MERTCKKCGAVNPDAAGEELDACPGCGAIYSKVEKVIALRAKLDAQTVRQPASPPPAIESQPVKIEQSQPTTAAKIGKGLRQVPLWVWGLMLIIFSPVTAGIVDALPLATDPQAPKPSSGLTLVQVIIGVVMICISADKRMKNAAAARRNALIATLGLDGYQPNDVYFDASRQHGIVIDESQKRVALYTFPQRRFVSFVDLLEVSIHEDGETITTSSRSKINVGRAIAGTLVAGPVGAAVGAFSGGRQTMSSKATVERIELRIVVKDVADPIIDFVFLRGSVPRNSETYRNISKLARTCEGALRAAMATID